MGAELASFDYATFAKIVRRACEKDGRGYRGIAPSIGVTYTDLCRAARMKELSSFPKVQAISDWIGFDPLSLYVNPNKINVLQSLPRETQEA